MKEKIINILLIIVSLILISTPFWILGIWNEEVNDLPCYDEHNKIIEGFKCSGTENKVMNKVYPIALFFVIIGCLLLVINSNSLLVKGDKK